MAIRIEPRDPLTQAQGVEAGYAQTARRWPSQPLVRRPLGAAELSGPQQLARRLPPARGGKAGDLAGYGDQRAIGQLARLRVRVLDEDGAPLPGTVVEVWHCNAAGKYIHPNDTHDAPVDPNFYGAARLSPATPASSSCAPSSRAPTRCPTLAAGGVRRMCICRYGAACGSRAW